MSQLEEKPPKFSQSPENKQKSEETNSPKLLEFQVRPEIKMLFPTKIFLEEKSAGPVGNCTLEEIAAWVDEEAIGFYTQKRAFAKVIVAGEIVNLTSDFFGHSGRYWIDGKIFSIAEVKAQFPENLRLIENMTKHGLEQVVKTRAGTFQEFVKEDSVVSSIPKSRAIEST